MEEVPWTFGAAFLQIEVVIRSGLMKYKQGGVWLGKNLFNAILGDNPKHKTKVIKNYVQCKEEQEVLEVIAWATQSSNLSVMECVCDNMAGQ